MAQAMPRLVSLQPRRSRRRSRLVSCVERVAQLANLAQVSICHITCNNTLLRHTSIVQLLNYALEYSLIACRVSFFKLQEII